MVFLRLAASTLFSRSPTLKMSPTIISNYDAGPIDRPVLFYPFALRIVVHPSRPVFRDDNELQIFVPVFSTAIWFSITWQQEYHPQTWRFLLPRSASHLGRHQAPLLGRFGFLTSHPYD